MKTTKTNLILYVVCTVAIIIAIISMFKVKQSQQELNELQNKMRAINTPTSENKLIKIDSLLVLGHYESAIDAYKKQFDTYEATDTGNTDLKLRIELAQRLMNMSIGTDIQDSIMVEGKKVPNTKVISATNGTETPTDIRSYDSLSFVLKKTRVQLDKVKKQLQNKSIGQYLTFKNTKNHKVHYVGQVKYNKANGYGVAILDTGSRYEGEWSDNVRQGKGSFYWPDGQSYVGDYSNDRRNGTGTYFWPNGEKYVGEWKNDQRDGEGVFYGKNGKVITKGVWKSDKLLEKQK